MPRHLGVQAASNARSTFVSYAAAMALFAVLPCFAPVNAAEEGSKAVFGTWKIRSIERETVDTGEKVAIWNPPAGFLTYTPDRRMHVILVSGTRKPQAGSAATDEEAMSLFRSMNAYAGRYTVEGNKVTHHIEVSANGSWTGTDEMRFYERNGDVLTIKTASTVAPATGKRSIFTLIWDRVKSP